MLGGDVSYTTYLCPRVLVSGVTLRVSTVRQASRLRALPQTYSCWGKILETNKIVKSYHPMVHNSPEILKRDFGQLRVNHRFRLSQLFRGSRRST